jgi:hypothetical protein
MDDPSKYHPWPSREAMEDEARGLGLEPSPDMTPEQLADLMVGVAADPEEG